MNGHSSTANVDAQLAAYVRSSLRSSPRRHAVGTVKRQIGHHNLTRRRTVAYYDHSTSTFSVRPFSLNIMAVHSANTIKRISISNLSSGEHRMRRRYTTQSRNLLPICCSKPLKAKPPRLVTDLIPRSLHSA